MNEACHELPLPATTHANLPERPAAARGAANGGNKNGRVQYNARNFAALDWLRMIYCDAFVANFTAAKFRALYSNSDALDQMESLLRHE
ncbi:hypothetical protein EVAR_40665_1 [Eumeta japonica]|uniref:Uncharacterized protein n=1 Tax=Eumeta variegata TaxID=151549 RepID=A0A4C1X331_EUMVA|nr:hypothetical protein EVAR_40665_1 [Eumeta japonica]